MLNILVFLVFWNEKFFFSSELKGPSFDGEKLKSAIYDDPDYKDKLYIFRMCDQKLYSFQRYFYTRVYNKIIAKLVHTLDFTGISASQQWLLIFLQILFFEIQAQNDIISKFTVEI